MLWRVAATAGALVLMAQLAAQLHASHTQAHATLRELRAITRLLLDAQQSLRTLLLEAGDEK